MESDLVVTERRASVLRITLNRVAKKNALTMAMYDQLTAALASARDDDAVCSVLIAGAPGVFTAGNDLGDFMHQPPASADTPSIRFLHALIDFPKPIVAAVDGPAVGIGTTMLLHCDHVLATERARFHMPFTKLGLVPEAAATLLVPALAGPQRAAAWLLLARPFDVHEALAAGVVSKLVPSAELDAAAEAVGAEFAALPRGAVIATKQLIRQGMRAAVGDALERELRVFVERLRAPETIAAFTAFMTRR